MTADVKITLRLPRELHEALSDAISQNRRSLNTEIVTRLEKSLGDDGAGEPRWLEKAQGAPSIKLEKRLLKIEAELARLRERVGE